MMDLKKFLQPITLARKPLQNYQAYRMDDNSEQSNMRKDVGLEPCNCCDYFLISNGVVVLIEETQLLRDIKNLQKEYNYLRGATQKEFIDKKILQENRLKAYGSMLVLCRLASVCKEAKDLFGTKKYKFWLVVSDQYWPRNARFFRNWKGSFFGDLKNVLGKKIVADVEIVPSHVFVGKLPKQAPFFQLTP